MSDFYVICFDVMDDKRLRKVATQMENFGKRVQYSIFECHLDANELHELQQRIDSIIDSQEDHLRYYRLCGKDLPKIQIDGRGTVSTESDYYLL